MPQTLITSRVPKDLCANEEVRSNCMYPEEYKRPKPIVNQIEALAKIFGLNPSHALKFAKNLPAFPEGAEGWFAIPSVDALAKKYCQVVKLVRAKTEYSTTNPLYHLYSSIEAELNVFPEYVERLFAIPSVDALAKKYYQAVKLVYVEIGECPLLCNYNYHDGMIIEGHITPEQLRVHARTARALKLITETQKGDILIVAAQLGMRHRGRSIRRAREVFAANEFGLGSLAVSSIVLTHPERLAHHYKELDIDCPGDEFSPKAGDNFPESPCFFSSGYTDANVFGARRVDNPRDDYGSASGFLSPQ